MLHSNNQLEFLLVNITAIRTYTFNMNKLVTAIITTHNRRILLERAIESVLAQTYEYMELIIVDDGSTDATEVYCEALVKSEKRMPIVYIRIEPGKGHGGNYARNLGIRTAKGTYVAFLDDDDMWLPEKTVKQVELIECMNNEIVYCGRKIEFVKEKKITYQDILPCSEHYGDMSRKILLTICTTTSSILVKRQTLFDIGLFDENLKFWQEYELTIRLAQRQPFYFVNEPLNIYRVDRRDKIRLTNKYFEWKQTVKTIHEKHRELYAKLNSYEKFMVHVLVWSDALSRCKSSGLKWHAYYFYVLVFIGLLPHRFGKVWTLFTFEK